MSVFPRSRVATGLAAFALVVLCAAVALAGWSLFGASRPPRPPADGSLDAAMTLGKLLLDGPALAVIAVGIVVAWLLVVGAVRPTQWQTGAGVVVLIVGPASLVLTGVLNDVPGQVRFARTYWTATGHAPAAAGALALAVLGTLAAAAALVLWNGPARSPMQWLPGVAVGVITAVAVGLVAGYEGDGGFTVDATAAAEAPVSPVPSGLGDRRFSMLVPPEHADSAGAVPVEAGGPGFIVREPRGVRAYDSSGAERWHYLRTGEPNLAVIGMRVFDAGRTVLLHLRADQTNSSRMPTVELALDASSGRTLWEQPAFGSDRTGSPLAVAELPFGSSYLMSPGKDHSLTRVDSRTGEPMWTWQPEGTCSSGGADTAAGLTLVSACTVGEQVRMRVRSLDADTGRVTFDEVVDEYTVIPHRSTPRVQVRPAGGDVVVFRDETGNAPLSSRGWRALDLRTGAVIRSGDPLVSLGDSGGDVVTHAQGYRLRAGPDLAARCVLPDGPRADAPIAWLADEVVMLASGTGISSFARSDCAPVRQRRPEAGTYEEILPAPGVLLAMGRTEQGLRIDGYGGRGPAGA